MRSVEPGGAVLPDDRGPHVHLRYQPATASGCHKVRAEVLRHDVPESASLHAELPSRQRQRARLEEVQAAILGLESEAQVRPVHVLGQVAQQATQLQL